MTSTNKFYNLNLIGNRRNPNRERARGWERKARTHGKVARTHRPTQHTHTHTHTMSRPFFFIYVIIYLKYFPGHHCLDAAADAAAATYKEIVIMRSRHFVFFLFSPFNKSLPPSRSRVARQYNVYRFGHTKSSSLAGYYYRHCRRRNNIVYAQYIIIRISRLTRGP